MAKQKSTQQLYVLLLLALISVFPFILSGQNMFDEPSFAAEPDITTEVKYTDGLIVFKLNLDNKFHITDLKNNFFFITLEKNDYIDIQKVIFPKGVAYGEDKVYKGQIDVMVYVKQLGAPTSSVTLKFKVGFQVCQERPVEMCFPPNEKNVDVVIDQTFTENASLPGNEGIDTESNSGNSAPLSAYKPQGKNWKILLLISLLLLSLTVITWFSKFLSDDDGIGIKFVKVILVIVALSGAYLFIKALDIKTFPAKYSVKPNVHSNLKWIPDLEQGKAKAREEKKPLFIDTTADWCVACKELEEYTFSDSDVIKMLDSYVLVRIDLTTKTEENEKIRSAFKIIGPPTLIVLDMDGKEIKRNAGFLDRDQFIGFLGSSTGFFDKLIDILNRELEKKSLLLIGLVLALGFLTSLTPCVYPVIPIVMGYIGTRSNKKKLKGFYLSIIFVLGLALVYSILGVVAAMTGSMMGISFQNPIVVIVISAIFVIMGLSLAGLFEIPVPSSISSKVQSSGNMGEIIGALMIGGVSGIIAAPCVGPVLLALLSWISQTQDIFLGFLLTFLFSLGMGIIFVLAGTFSGVISALPKGGQWMNNVKYFFAILLIGGGIYILNAIIPQWLNLLLWGLFFISVSVFGGLIASYEEYNYKQKLYKLLLIIVLLFGVFLFYKSMELGLFTNPASIPGSKVVTAIK